MLLPEQALERLAGQLRDEDTVISPHARPAEAPRAVLGALVAAGPRTVRQPAEYALLIETIREGYLLHYGEPRVVAGVDDDLALLAGDYLYARGLERLAGLGDLEAVRELSDLISLSAQLEADRRSGAGPLWLGAVVAVACGADPAHDEAKAALREADDAAPAALWNAASQTAIRLDLADRLERAAESIGFVPH